MKANRIQTDSLSKQTQHLDKSEIASLFDRHRWAEFPSHLPSFLIDENAQRVCQKVSPDAKKTWQVAKLYLNKATTLRRKLTTQTRIEPTTNF